MTTVVSPPSSPSGDHQHQQRKLNNRRSRFLNIFGFDQASVPTAPSTATYKVTSPPPFLTHASRSQSIGPSASVSYTTVHGHGRSDSVSSGSAKKRSRSKVHLMDVFNARNSQREMRELGLAEVEAHEWRISVANDGQGQGGRLVIYADTPTNIYTLFRTTDEIRQLTRKELPSSLLRSQTSPKRAKLQRSNSRRSSFLSSFSSKLGAVLDGTNRSRKSSRDDSRPTSPPLTPGAPQLMPFDMTTFSPIASPTGELDDPMSMVASVDGLASSTMTSSTSVNSIKLATPTAAIINHGDVANYLSALANAPTVNASRHWKAFIKVRADDFESIRVERKIKKARSVHLDSPSTLKAEDEVDDGILCISTDVSTATSPLQSPLEGSSSLSTAYQYTEEAENSTSSSFSSHVPVPKELPAVSEEDEGTVRYPKIDARPVVPAEWKAESAEPSQATTTPIKHGKKRGAKLEDFELIRVVGKGCAGKVLLVKHKTNSEIFAMKTIHKRHVLAHQELRHTLTEQKVLKRMSREGANPFVIHMHYSFTDKENLYLVLDFHPGGDLATQLERWGRIGRDRARFYSAEIVEGVEALHSMGIIYRDLKPENVLLAADGHVVLVDFGLAAEFPQRTLSAKTGISAPSSRVFGGTGLAAKFGDHWGRKERDLASSFVGTAEYLAPEVIQGFPYSYEVDWWSLGTMLYEALMGVTPFWADNHAEMYSKVLHNELTFLDDYPTDQDTKSFIRGLLQKDPNLRLTEPRIKRHAYFSMIDFEHIRMKRYIPPYTPETDQSKEYDTQNFSTTFLEMEPTVNMREPGEEVPEVESADVTQQRDDAFRTYSFATRPLGLSADELAEEESDEQLAEPQANGQVLEASVFEVNDATSAVPSDGLTPTNGAQSESGLATPVAPVCIPSEPVDIIYEQTITVTPVQSAPAAVQAGDSVTREDIAVYVQPQSRDDDGEEEGEEDWERVERVPGGEALNGNHPKTLFARGVVDRYKMSVLKRKDSTMRRSASSLRLGSHRRSSVSEDLTKSTSRLHLRTKLRVKPRTSRGSAAPSQSFGTSVGRSESGLSIDNTPSDTSAASSPLVSPSASNSSIPVGAAVMRGTSLSASTLASHRSASPEKIEQHPVDRKPVRIKSMATASTEALKSWIHKTSSTSRDHSMHSP